MRIFIATLGTETNTFSPLPTGRQTFEETLCLREASRHSTHFAAVPVVTWRRLGEADGHTIVESLSAFAQPGGPTVRAVYEGLRDEILGGPPGGAPGRRGAPLPPRRHGGRGLRRLRGGRDPALPGHRGAASPDRRRARPPLPHHPGHGRARDRDRDVQGVPARRRGRPRRRPLPARERGGPGRRPARERPLRLPDGRDVPHAGRPRPGLRRSPEGPRGPGRRAGGLVRPRLSLGRRRGRREPGSSPSPTAIPAQAEPARRGARPGDLRAPGPDGDPAPEPGRGDRPGPSGSAAAPSSSPTSPTTPGAARRATPPSSCGAWWSGASAGRRSAASGTRSRSASAPRPAWGRPSTSAWAASAGVVSGDSAGPARDGPERRAAARADRALRRPGRLRPGGVGRGGGASTSCSRRSGARRSRPTPSGTSGSTCGSGQLVVVKSTQHFYAAFAPIARAVLYVSTPGAIPPDFASIPYTKRRTAVLAACRGSFRLR